MKVIFFILLASASARELYPGQYSQVPPELRKWFNEQRSPLTGQTCCTEADGVAVQEDIRRGTYWTKGGPFPDWVPVPHQVVLRGPNKNGAPVLWWFTQDGQPQIKCYAPGAGL